MARNYEALPHEYLEEMGPLTDEEFGRLVRGLLRYSMTGEVLEPVGNERFYVRRIMAQEDRYQASYDELIVKRSEAGKRGAAIRWAQEEDPENGKAIFAIGKHGNTETDTETKPKPKPKPKPKSILPPSSDGREGTGSTPSERMRRDMAAIATLPEEGKGT